MNRREFLAWVGVGGIASYLPVALVACANTVDESSIANTPTRPDGFVTVGTLTELKQKGQLSQETILVIPSPSDSTKIIAVNPTCSHAGCAVEWEKDEKAFLCPCHDSLFSSEGKVLQGPAKSPLPVYPTKIEGDKILVKTS